MDNGLLIRDIVACDRCKVVIAEAEPVYEHDGQTLCRGCWRAQPGKPERGLQVLLQVILALVGVGGLFLSGGAFLSLWDSATLVPGILVFVTAFAGNEVIYLLWGIRVEVWKLRRNGERVR